MNVYSDTSRATHRRTKKGPTQTGPLLSLEARPFNQEIYAPQSLIYENDRCLVEKILADGMRKRAALFGGLLRHHLNVRAIELSASDGTSVCKHCYF